MCRRRQRRAPDNPAEVVLADVRCTRTETALDMTGHGALPIRGVAAQHDQVRAVDQDLPLSALPPG